MMPLFSATKTRPSGENARFVGSVSPENTTWFWNPVGRVIPAAWARSLPRNAGVATNTAATSATAIARAKRRCRAGPVDPPVIPISSACCSPTAPASATVCAHIPPLGATNRRVGRSARTVDPMAVDAVEAVELRRVRLPLRTPWRTSYGIEHERDVLLVRVRTAGGVDGWGECGALSTPGYSPEWVDGAHEVLRRFLVPA